MREEGKRVGERLGGRERERQDGRRVKESGSIWLCLVGLAGSGRVAEWTA